LSPRLEAIVSISERALQQRHAAILLASSLPGDVVGLVLSRRRHAVAGHAARQPGGTRAWAVSYDDVYQQVQLLHSFGPAHPPNPPVTDLAITAATGTGKDKHTATITVTWTSPAALHYTAVSACDHFWWVTASTNGGAERKINRGRLDSSGRYTFTYALPKGATTFTARYHDTEDWYPDGYATATLRS
jgi:hypothetical protein